MEVAHWCIRYKKLVSGLFQDFRAHIPRACSLVFYPPSLSVLSILNNGLKSSADSAVMADFYPHQKSI